MIIYPVLTKGDTIAVTAPSSGVDKGLHPILKEAVARFEQNGYRVTCGNTAWTQDKAKSAPAKKRAKELNEVLKDETTGAIIPPWGGELLIEILEHLQFDRVKEKWILGYSDTSLLLLAITVNTGLATAHGTNFVDLRGEETDKTTAMWERVLQTATGESVVQYSSDFYQTQWQFDNPTPWVFHLDEKTEWKTVSGSKEKVEGRLLGGCIDVIHHLVGTPFGDVKAFQAERINGEPILWYFENCDLSTTDLKRCLVQMKMAGWFDHCSGILFGRSASNTPVENYTAEDVYKEMAHELGVPVIYDVDCGHVPPQVTLVNGAYATVSVDKGKGTIEQFFKA
ncbi:S66 family peptidase [Alteribacter aurantiacus]|uniref:S66 family peptidase n=1 Tax=Alteribacter aurantiacus TaxID=254410 RepID=UPI0004222150|nr:S66 peptidase family protein [Alteribacter aurantiacus]